MWPNVRWKCLTEKSGFPKNKGIKLATVVGGSVPSHHSSTSTNQWISQIVALTSRTKSVSNESVFFTQKTTPTRAFLRNCTRAKSQSYSCGHPVNLLYTVNRLISRELSLLRIILLFAIGILCNDVIILCDCINRWKNIYFF